MKRIFTFLVPLPACGAVLLAIGLATASLAQSSTNTNAAAHAQQTNAMAQAEETNTAPKVPGDKFTNSVEMELIKVPAGYWAGEYEVTQKEYQKVMGANPSSFSGETRPVDSVSWNDAVDFCKKLTEQDLKEKKLPEGYYYTLPTEAEWESLVAGADLSDAVTSRGGRRDSTAPVGSLGANSLGLYDVRGNVSEFCLGEPDKPYRVLRGGSWADRIEVNLRVEFRTYARPDEAKNTFGFRVVLKSGTAAAGGGGD